MAKKDYTELAKNILGKVGGTENITRAYHCMARLRLNVKDKGLVKVDEIGKIDGVTGYQWNGNQLQIIIGQHVDDVYQDFCKESGLNTESKIEENLDDEKRKFGIDTIRRECDQSCVSNIRQVLTRESRMVSPDLCPRPLSRYDH